MLYKININSIEINPITIFNELVYCTICQILDGQEIMEISNFKINFFIARYFLNDFTNSFNSFFFKVFFRFNSKFRLNTIDLFSDITAKI